jgi:hypothetical protein
VILWPLGIACALTYVSLGRRRIDYRFVLLGAALPDALDAAVGLLWPPGPADRGIAHSLVGVIVVTAAIIVFTSGTRRLALFGLGVGWLLHLVADGMWFAPRTFLWPAFGFRFARAPASPYSWDVLIHPWAHWGTWAKEAAGAAILAWFWVAFRLGEGERMKLFLKDGYLRP